MLVMKSTKGKKRVGLTIEVTLFGLMVIYITQHKVSTGPAMRALVAALRVLIERPMREGLLAQKQCKGSTSPVLIAPTNSW